jgi:hypothetical protein
MEYQYIEHLLDGLLEQLAAVEHERWSHWQRYVHSKCVRQPDGSLLLPAGLVARWEKQIDTKYAELDEQERERIASKCANIFRLLRLLWRRELIVSEVIPLSGNGFIESIGDKMVSSMNHGCWAFPLLRLCAHDNPDQPRIFQSITSRSYGDANRPNYWHCHPKRVGWNIAPSSVAFLGTV